MNNRKLNTVVASAIAMLALTFSFMVNAKIVENGLTGNVGYDGWDSLGGIPGYGFGTSWASPLGSFESGSGDADLNRNSGGHFSATLGLYSLSGPSNLSVDDSSAIAGLETVVFSVDTTLGAEDLALLSTPTLSYNGGTQSLIADFDFSSALPTATGTPFGDVDAFAYTFQWDLSGMAVTSFNIDWDQQLHSVVRGLQLEQSDSYSLANAQVVPVPGAAWLFASAGLLLTAFRRERSRA